MTRKSEKSQKTSRFYWRSLLRNRFWSKKKISTFGNFCKTFKIKSEEMVDNHTQKKFEQKSFQKLPYFQIWGHTLLKLARQFFGVSWTFIGGPAHIQGMY